MNAEQGSLFEEEPHPTIRYVRCVRCQLSMRVLVKQGNPDALLMAYASGGEGLCASCAATEMLYRVEHIKHTIDAKHELLLWDVMQKRFAELMQAGNADAKPTEISWQTVYDNWDLPFPKRKRGKP